MIEVSQLCRRYGRHLAVENIAFQVPKGQICGLLGPNGAGKSTIMNILTGYLAPTEGSVRVAGHDLAREPMAVRSSVGYLPERPPLYPEMTVREYLSFAAELKRLGGAGRVSELGRVCSRLGLEQVEHTLISTLSKGYQQRVGIAQALLGNPPLIILDEPMVGLDPEQVAQVRRLIRELGREHTVLLSSHILAEMEAVCDRLLILSEGHLQADGTLSELRAAYSAKTTLTGSVAGSAQAVQKALAPLGGQLELSNAGAEVSFVLTPENPAKDLRPEVSRALTAVGCTVLSLGQKQQSLESIYLKLTESKSEEEGCE